MTRNEINRKIREVLGLTTKELGERVETTKQTISNYERGKTTTGPLRRVIELELDLAIQQEQDKTIKSICEILKQKREES